MRCDEHISPDEEESRFEKELEQSINAPLYMQASWEQYCLKPTDKGAMVLWLKYTKANEPIPENVMKRFVDHIEDMVINSGSELYPKEIDNDIYELIHLALSNKSGDLDKFWNILHGTSHNGLGSGFFYNDKLLERARAEFPNQKKLTRKELFCFAATILDLDPEAYKSTIDRVVEKRYLTHVRNITKFMAAF